jgi:hypothetical protein
MNTTQLKARLISEGFKADVYGIEGSLPAFEGLVLEKHGARWKIEHFERGIRRELDSFTSESEACDRMYELLTKHFR